MTKFSCYHTISGNIISTFCQLSEKCYSNSTKLLAITYDQLLIPELDRSLWTFAKIKYIPHATNCDPMPELQPIYITDKLENPNQAEVIIFINASKQMILDLMIGEKEIKASDFKRIIFLFDNNSEIIYEEVVELITKSPITNYDLECFKQEIKGNWQKIEKVT
ncbi:MAG: DNA polymerase III subunit chi [Rickettsiaceae bacterium]|nr:DNA polymerase III subunit chi [Rickettsiaceae bacterium]